MDAKLRKLFIRMTKITTYAMVFCISLTIGICSTAGAQQKLLKEISIDLNSEEGSSLIKVIKEIEKSTDFLFLYSQKELRDRTVNIEAGTWNMSDLLHEISGQAKLSIKRVNETISVTSVETKDADVVDLIVTQQQITGNITDDQGEALPGASVVVSGTTTGTITDIDGNYSLTVPSDASSLDISFVGMKTITVPINGRSVINVELAPDLGELQEVVVIGYGSRQKKDLTGAISVMNSDDITQSNAMSPDLAMAGKMAGVLSVPTSGNPQDRPNIQIRGMGTFNVIQPLYVIDGIPVTEYGSGYEGTGSEGARNRDLRGPVNVLSLINPQDIESISVLKDASAAAIYGVRAANGVVLITTKSGGQGAPKVDYDFRTGIKRVPNTFDLLGVSDYVSLYQEAYANNPNLAASMPLVFDPSTGLNRGPYEAYLGDRPTIHWQTPMINDNARLQDHSIKVYGGSETVDYFVSAGYAYQDGPFIYNNMDRYSFSSNVNSKGKILDVGAIVKISYLESRDQSPELTNAVSAPPWQPLLAQDDYYTSEIPADVLARGYATTIDTTQSINPNHPQWGGTGQLDETPIYLQNNLLKYGPETESNYLARGDEALSETKFGYLRTLGTAYAAIKFLDGFKFKASYSVDYYTQRRNQWNSIDRGWYGITSSNFWAEGNYTGTTLGSYGERHTTNYSLTGELTLNYNKSFGDHNVDVVLNFMDQQIRADFHAFGSGENVIDDPERRFVQEQTALTNSGFSGFNQQALQGYMARTSYNYAGKYYVDLTVRRDGSYRFAPEYRWGIFPSVALAWRATSEDFIPQVSWLNDLKFRAGWGQLGNQETLAFAYLSTVTRNPQYNTGSLPGDGIGVISPGAALPDFPTEDLSWETTTTSNIGFDALMFSNKLNLTIEWYNKVTSDILQQASISPAVGNGRDPILNLAEVRNRGFEFQLGWNDRIGGFEYFVNGNFTTVNNEVLSVFNDQPFFALVGGTGNINGGQSLRVEEGRSLFHFWGYEVGGIFQTQEEIDNYQQAKDDQVANNALVAPGDFWFRDVHGAPTEEEKFYSIGPDSIVNSNDRTYLGNSIPEYYYGLTFGGSFKGFDLTFFFQGVGGFYKFNGELQKGVSMSSTGINQWTNVLNRWTPENPNTWNPDDRVNSLPRAVAGDPAGNGRYSDRFIEKAGFMRLRDVTLGYNLHSKITSNISWLDRLRVSFSGQNILTFTNWSGLDPENDNVPIPNIWTVGVNATFK